MDRADHDPVEKNLEAYAPCKQQYRRNLLQPLGLIRISHCLEYFLALPLIEAFGKYIYLI